MAQRTNRTEKLDLRLTPAAKDTLRLAAESFRETVSDFVLKSALARADEILADRRVNNFLKQYALTNQASGGAQTYVAALGELVAGYYSLATGEVARRSSSRKSAAR
jgi:uncharacterized protein (DUF1778 family)